MSYINQSLSDGEDIVHKFTLHWMIWIKNCTGLAVGIAIMAMTTIFGLPEWLEYPSFLISSATDLSMSASRAMLPLLIAIALGWKSTWRMVQLFFIEQASTNRRVIYKQGIVSRNTVEIRLHLVESISFHQSILGRFFGYGNVHITGTGSSPVWLLGIKDPVKAKSSLEALLKQKHR